jgi:hypothetical protein
MKVALRLREKQNVILKARVVAGSDVALEGTSVVDEPAKAGSVEEGTFGGGSVAGGPLG